MSLNSVLFLTYWYPNKINKSFGIFVKRHAQAIKQNNNLVVLSLNISKGNTFYNKTIHVTVDENGIETHQINLDSKYYKLLYVLLPIHVLILKKYIQLNLISKHKFNILHSNIIFPCGIVGYKLSKTFGLKHIITEHWTKLDKFFKINLYAASGKRVLTKSNALTVVSKQVQNTLLNYTQNKNISIVPNVIESKEFYFDSTIVKNSEFTFIAIANWAQHKNPFYFLNAIAVLYHEKKLQNFKVVLIGDGEQINRVKERNFQFKIEYKGILSSPEINLELNKSHVFVHGSDFETFSVVIAEALMCGLPCVLSPVGIALEVISTINGFVTDNTDDDWKQKIYQCYQSKYDYELISNQLKNKFSLKTVGNLFDKVYANV